jgi:hypothetical protein
MENEGAVRYDENLVKSAFLWVDTDLSEGPMKERRVAEINKCMCCQMGPGG